MRMSLKALLRAAGFVVDSADSIQDEMSLGSDFARLENRIVYSGSPMGEMSDVNHPIDSVDPDRGGLVDPLGEDGLLAGVDPISESDLSEHSIERHGLSAEELDFVDAGSDDYEELLDELLDSRPDKSLDVGESSVEGVAKITQASRRFIDFDAIHIVAHGNDGHIQFGNGSPNVSSPASHAADVALRAAAVASSFEVAATSVGQISGFVYEDVNGDSVLDDGILGTPVAAEGVDVYLYRDDDGIAGISAGDSYVDQTQTTATGDYAFDVLVDGDYFVVVDSTTVEPSAGYTDPTQHTLSDVWAVQTYGTEGALAADGNGGTEVRTDPGFAGAVYGGRQAGVSDNASAGLMQSQHVTAVTVNSNVISDVDFGFSFNVVTNMFGGDNLDHDPEERTIQGSLRQFILNANAIAGPNAMRFVPATPPTSSDGSDTWWSLDVSVLFPAVEDDQTSIDGRAYEFKDAIGIDGGRTFRDSNTFRVGSTEYIGLGPDLVRGDGINIPFDEGRLDGVPGPELELSAPLVGVLDYGLLVIGDGVRIEHIAINGFGDSSGVLGGGNIQVGTDVNSPQSPLIQHTILGAGPTADDFELASNTEGGKNHGVLIRNASDGFFLNNVVARSAGSGVKLDNSQGWTINNNEIRGNGVVFGNQDGIDISAGSGGILVQNNLVTGNVGAGIDTYESTGLNYIQDNTISGNGSPGQEGAGVRLFGDANIVSQNLIENNTFDGVLVLGDQPVAQTPSTRNLITHNSFVGNGERAIDLGRQLSNINRGDGVNSADGLYELTTGNSGIDRPLLNSVIFDGSQLNIIFTPQLTTHEIEIYVAAPADPSDFHGGDYYGEGQYFVATAMPSVSSPTGYVIGGTPSYPIGADDRVTLLAIDSNENTSEFSNVLDVEYTPDAIDDVRTVAENGSLTDDASLNDVDEDNQTLTYSLISGPPANVGSFELNANGTFDYVAAPSYSGVFTVQYRATDSIGLFDDAAIAITVTDDNVEETLTTNEPLLIFEGDIGTVISQIVLETNDPDDPPTDIRYTITLPSKEGDLLLDGVALGIGGIFTQADINAGVLTYDHGSSDAPGDNFWFTVDDGQGTLTNGLFSIAVENREESLDVNLPLNVFKGTAGTITNVLLQTSDLDDATAELIYTVNVLPADGELLLSGTQLAVGETFSQADIDAGFLSYAHDPVLLSDAPSDSFQFTVDDGQGLRTTDQFNINVQNSEESLDVNQPLDVFEGEAVQISNASLLTSDVDDSATELVYQITQLPAVGELRLNGAVLGTDDTFTQADIDGGDLFYWHDSSDSAGDTFRFDVDDGQGSATSGLFSIVVTNREEILVISDSVSVLEGGQVTVSASNLLTEDVDDDAIELVYEVIDSVGNGQLFLDGAPLGVGSTFTQDDINNGQLGYVHNGGETSYDMFRFTVDDGQGTASFGDFDIDVLPANDSPTLTTPGLQQVVEELPLTFSSAIGNAITLGDPDAAGSEVRLTLDPVNGTVSLPVATLSTLDFITGDGVDDDLIVVEGTISDLNRALDGLVFISNVGYFGVTPLTVTVNDLGNTGSPGPLAVTNSISIEVQDTPTATDDFYRTLGGQALVVGQADNLLRNDILWPAVSGPSLITGPSHGTLLWNGDGRFTYAPTGAFVGTDTFVYGLVNGLAADTATVTITVLPAQQADPDPPPGATPPTNGGGSPDAEVPTVNTPGAGIPLPGQIDSRDDGESVNRSSSSSESQQELDQQQPGSSDEVRVDAGSQTDSRRIGGRYESAIGGLDTDFEIGVVDAVSEFAVDTFDTSSLFGTLDYLEDSMLGMSDVSGWRAQSGLALTGGLSIGWVLWSLKGGYIIGSLLSTASPWTLIDPLPVLDTIESKQNKHKRKDQASDKLEQMID